MDSNDQSTLNFYLFSFNLHSGRIISIPFSVFWALTFFIATLAVAIALFHHLLTVLFGLFAFCPYLSRALINCLLLECLLVKD